MRTFNISRLARSACCQSPFHVTPMRGGSVGVDPVGHVLETPSTQPRGRLLRNPITLPRIAVLVNSRCRTLAVHESKLARYPCHAHFWAEGTRGRRSRRATVFRAHKTERL